jgi:glycosyltransferase involved in cell wall biosynthesis
MIYFTTPWRGLEVLLKCMEELKKDKDITLDVYSSTKIYGDAFQEANDKLYKPLYDKCEELPNVNYKGYCTHKELMGKLHEYDVSAHPSIWEETFCISAMEALAAGLVLITTDLGAIPETCGEFPIYVPYNKEYDNLAIRFTAGIQAIKGMFKNDINDILDFQKNYYKKFYDWNVIGLFWRRFLLGAYRDKREKIRKQNEV